MCPKHQCEHVPLIVTSFCPMCEKENAAPKKIINSYSGWDLEGIINRSLYTHSSEPYSAFDVRGSSGFYYLRIPKDLINCNTSKNELARGNVIMFNGSYIGTISAIGAPPVKRMDVMNFHAIHVPEGV